MMLKIVFCQKKRENNEPTDHFWRTFIPDIRNDKINFYPLLN